MPHSIWSAFIPSSSASTSPSNSPRKDHSKRRLTRQRKLRYVTEDGLGLCPQSMPASPDDGSESRTPPRWFKSAVPLPLPLPELTSLPRNSNTNDNSSPTKDGPSIGECDPPSPPVSSETSQCHLSLKRFAATHSTVEKSTRDFDRGSCKSPMYSGRGFSKQLSVEEVQYDFRLNAPARSAPSSGLSSPVLSPQRFRVMDPFHSPSNASSSFKASHSDRITSSLQLSPTRVSRSLEHSPLQSPRSNNHPLNTGKHNTVLLQSHNKSLPEVGLDGNNTNVHPLPRPPGSSRPSQSPSVGQQMDKSYVTSSVKGQWKKGRLIGRGTYGSVYIATNSETGALCAMKEVDLVLDDPKGVECVRQLEQEIKVLQQLKHPNIVEYYGSEIIEDHFCIYLEYVHPGSINKYIHEHCRAMTESVVRHFTRHIVSGLAYLHSKKTVHRDIKGANLLVDAHGVVKLADFGLAKHLSGHAIDLSLKGSPYWMAPEVLQAVMRKDANPEHAFGVDIWSLGCTVIEMLTGKPPWSEFSGVQAMFNVLNRSPPIPGNLSSESKDFLECCFRRQPGDRPTAAMLLDHPFLRNSHEQNLATCQQVFCGMKLSENGKPQSQRYWTKQNKELMPIPSSMLMRKGELPYNSECLQSYPQVSDSGHSCRHSPRSTLEVLPTVTSPESNLTSHDMKPL